MVLSFCGQGYDKNSTHHPQICLENFESSGDHQMSPCSMEYISSCPMLSKYFQNILCLSSRFCNLLCKHIYNFLNIKCAGSKNTYCNVVFGKSVSAITWRRRGQRNCLFVSEAVYHQSNSEMQCLLFLRTVLCTQTMPISAIDPVPLTTNPC